MKQIHEAVQALESDITFWRPSLIFVEEAKKIYLAILPYFDDSQNEQN